MLKNLVIRDFAIIDALDLDLMPGMTVLTGETGAGKSIIIDALHLVLGGRANTDVIRTGSDTAEVTATFGLMDAELRARVETGLRSQDIPLDDDELLIRRIISRSGRSKVYVNGALITVAVLQDLAGGLVDITGQHEHVWLLQPDTQLELLDAYAGLGELRVQLAAQYDVTRKVNEELKGLRQNEQEQLAREDFLRFQVGELKDLNPVLGEEAGLNAQRKKLANGERLKIALAQAEETLYSGEHAAVEMVGAVRDSLRALSDVDEGMGPLASALADAQAIIEDVSRSLHKQVQRVAVDPERLAEMEERLERYHRTSRKHACTADGLVAKLDELSRELHTITHRDEVGKGLEKQLADHKRQLLAMCTELSDGRRKAALKLAKATLEELAGLGMERAGLQIAIDPLPMRQDASDVSVEMNEGPPRRVGPRGMDRVEFRISANPGEEMRALAKVASGGELSRVMLALKRVLASRDPVPVYIFDEVDAGVSGSVGESIGTKIRGVSRERQAMCVTHLPQIAAQAEHHLMVEKVVQNGRTATRVRALNGDDRVEELARMLGGRVITDATRANARDLLQQAGAAA